ncbi:MAG: Sec-independent protein translocase protein TatB [Psychrobacter sp.]
MFDIGFSELLLFGVIALIVLGPEKLPQAARTAGQWYAKIRRTASTLQSEIEAELDLAETRQQMQKELAKIRQTETEMKREMAEMRGNMKEFEYSQNQTLKATQNTVDKPQYAKNHKANGKTDDKQLPATKEGASNEGEVDNEQNNPLNKSKSFSPKSEDKNDDDDKGNIDNISGNSDGSTESIIQSLNTKPWENMWFRLGDYDKARRLPAAPYLPNYKADHLLNSTVDQAVSHAANTQTSANQQEGN